MSEIYKHFPKDEFKTQVFSKYCVKYSQLDRNWKHLTDSLKTRKQKVVIVDDPLSSEKVLRSCNFLTKKGYIVRNSNEFEPCEGCKGAKLTKEFFSFLKSQPELSSSIPDEWDGCN